MSDHRERYKNTSLDAKELRRRREEASVQLRKQKRDDVLSKRRTMAPASPPDEMVDDDESESIRSDGTDFTNQQCHITSETVQGLMQDENLQLLIDEAQKVRKILSKEPQPPIDEVIQSGLIPRFAELLKRDDCAILQFEVAWVLTNVASGTSEQTKTIVDSGATKTFIELLRSPHPEVCEQAVWALGNIVGDNGDFRDKVIHQGFVPALLALINPGEPIGVSFLRNATWVLVNLCRNKEPPTDISVIRQLLPALMYLIESEDQTILIDTTWAISYITEIGPAYSQLIIDSGLVKKITRLISHQESKIKTAAIRALGCIATGSDEQTQAVVDAGAIPELRKAFDGINDRIAKEALWFLSNVVAGSQDQIQAVIDENLVPMIIHFLSSGDYQQQKEASWTVFNFCLTGSPDQLKVLIKEGAIPALCDLLTMQDNTLIRNVLDAIKSLLKKCDDQGVRDMIEECGGLDRIEALQSSTNQEIYQYAYVIIETYFSDDNDNAFQGDA